MYFNTFPHEIEKRKNKKIKKLFTYFVTNKTIITSNLHIFQ